MLMCMDLLHTKKPPAKTDVEPFACSCPFYLCTWAYGLKTRTGVKMDVVGNGLIMAKWVKILNGLLSLPNYSKVFLMLWRNVFSTTCMEPLKGIRLTVQKTHFQSHDVSKAFLIWAKSLSWKGDAKGDATTPFHYIPSLFLSAWPPS